jgi:hypothetical protein
MDLKFVEGKACINGPVSWLRSLAQDPRTVVFTPQEEADG